MKAGPICLPLRSLTPSSWTLPPPIEAIRADTAVLGLRRVDHGQGSGSNAAMAKYFGILAVLLCLLAGGSASAEEATDGDWFGGFERGPDWICAVVRLETGSTGGARGTCDLPLERLAGLPLRDVTLKDGHVEFAFSAGERRYRFEGEVKGRAIDGQLVEGGRHVRLHLDRVVAVDVGRYAGTFKMDDGRFINLKASSEIGFGCLVATDFRTGEVRSLLPTSATRFFCGPAILVADPVEATVEFAQDPATGATRLAWRQNGAPPRVGKSADLRREDVSFKNGNARLAARVVLPPGKVPHPAVVLIHGSGPGSRDELITQADFFALNGIASLVYDKRGCGESTGDIATAEFGDLAGDALAGLALLRGRGDVDRARVGLWGISQGGWLVAVAASRSPEVAFVINESGPGCTVEQQCAFNNANRMRADGFSEEDIGKMLAFDRLNGVCARTDAGWDELAAAGKVAATRPWYRYTNGTSGPGAGARRWGRMLDFDPVPCLRKVRCPVLAIFGEADIAVPAEASAATWKQALEASGNKDVTVKVFAHGNHQLFEAKTGALRDIPRSRGFVAGYFETQRDWLISHLGGK